MIELRSSVMKEKPIIALMELEAKHGGLTRARIEEELVESVQRYEKWGFDDDGPGSAALVEALHAAGRRPPPLHVSRRELEGVAAQGLEYVQ